MSTLTYPATAAYLECPESTITLTAMIVRLVPYATTSHIAIIQMYYHPKKHTVDQQVAYYLDNATTLRQKDHVHSHYYYLTNSILHMRYP